MPNAIHLSRIALNTNHNNAPFNGKDQSGSALPAAVYFYTLNLETTYGKTVQKTGNVTVVR